MVIFCYNSDFLKPQKTCSTCVESKATRLPFKACEKQSKRIGDLIFSDVCGPITPASIDDEHYFQVIVDDFSHFVVVMFLRQKKEVADKLIG